MAQQKSEDRVVLDGGVMPVQPGGSSSVGHGKAVPVDEAVSQLRLPIATAVAPEGGSRRRFLGWSGVRAAAGVPKATGSERVCVPATMDGVVQRLGPALLKVVSNKGAPGPDGMTVQLLKEQWPVVSRRLTVDLLTGLWCPGEVRRVLIPKAGGGMRGLGIPNVTDRVVMEAIRQVLEPVFEPTFHPSSHGFRPGRSCHTAIAEAGGYLQDGHEWVVDVDLEKCFDRVNHQRLMARLATRVSDRGLLVLIGRLLKAGVVLPDGVRVATVEGVPQGSPLSPLLSNVVLDELDRELARRGHRFVRYADDCNVYVQSERAGQRVMASLERFIDSRLRLKINREKSAVARPEDRHFLGFCLRRDPRTGAVDVLLSPRTRRNAMARIRELTPRNWGGTLDGCIQRINAWLAGWHQFFGIAAATEEFTLRALDAHIRRRLRAILLKHWKRRRTIARNLVALGVKRQSAWNQVYAGRRSTWALSHSPAVNRAMPVKYFTGRGLLRLVALHARSRRNIIAPAQAELALDWG